MSYYSFFFQAEDGIRDIGVTGVQTCALPISTFDMKFFTSLAILVFAVGGCEKISPYVNKMKNPERGFSKGMITLSIMVAVCAILGTISLGKIGRASCRERV